MRNIIVLAPLAVSALLMASCGGETAAVKPAAAMFSAELMKGDAKVGTATLTQAGANSAMSLKVEGLATGIYGMHIHETGKCDAPDFKSAGGHWNPGAKQHGLQNLDGTHGGDLENLVATNGQATRLERSLAGFKLSDEGGLMDADGAAFIIHAKPDDNKTDPSGNSGDRIICGVFKAG
jgi:superoxide dismutase, Cu-Zn family